MCERAARDIIDAEICQRRDLLLRHISGDLDLSPAVDDLHGLLHRLVIHVVEHDNIRAGLHSLAHLAKRLDLDLNLADKRRVRLRHANCIFHTAGGTDVVVL